jgi:carbamoyl-phosphate synthase large subunit
MICGIMEHIEEAGIHSGDSACVLPPHTLSRKTVDEIRRVTMAIARELKVVGLINIQYAIREDEVYVLEVNPRASRTVPFVSKASGVPWAKIAAQVMTGVRLADIPEARSRDMDYFAVKESVLPFSKFPGADTVLGPEMKSTGEVMGLDSDFGIAYAKSQDAAGNSLPHSGTVFISVKNSMYRSFIFIAKKIADMGFKVCATEGTCRVLRSNGVNATVLKKIFEGKPNVVDLIKSNAVQLVINVPAGRKALADSKPIRSAAVTQGIPYITTLEGAQAATSGMDSIARSGYSVKSIQEYAGVDSGRKTGTREQFEARKRMWG